MESVQATKQRFGIIGNDIHLNRAIEKAIQVSPTDISVLVTGESGVGKESIPKIIHQLSHRKHGKYIAVIKSPTAKKYKYMKRDATSVFQINATEAGMYEVSGSYTNINNNKNFQLKYDRGFSRKRSVTVVNAQALFLFPIIVSLILFLYAYSRDRL